MSSKGPQYHPKSLRPTQNLQTTSISPTQPHPTWALASNFTAAFNYESLINMDCIVSTSPDHYGIRFQGFHYEKGGDLSRQRTQAQDKVQVLVSVLSLQGPPLHVWSLPTSAHSQINRSLSGFCKISVLIRETCRTYWTPSTRIEKRLLLASWITVFM